MINRSSDIRELSVLIADNVTSTGTHNILKKIDVFNYSLYGKK